MPPVDNTPSPLHGLHTRLSRLDYFEHELARDLFIACHAGIKKLESLLRQQRRSNSEKTRRISQGQFDALMVLGEREGKRDVRMMEEEGENGTCDEEGEIRIWEGCTHGERLDVLELGQAYKRVVQLESEVEECTDRLLRLRWRAEEGRWPDIKGLEGLRVDIGALMLVNEGSG